MSHHQLIADDADDLALVAAVAPSGWHNPTPRDFYHLVVVGAGPGGLVAAAGAAGLGARVALVERSLMGGDCLNFGCVPSKALLRSAHFAHAQRAAPDFGIEADAVQVRLGEVLRRLRRVRSELALHDSAKRFTDLGVDVFLGTGCFGGKDVVRVGDQQLRFKRALIATGARPDVPPIPGLLDVAYHTNESIFSITALPRHLVVLGGGPIGCELAQAFRRLGCRVSIVEQRGRLLARDDPMASAALARQLESEGVTLALGFDVARVSADAGGIQLTCRDERQQAVTGDALLVATGRRPNVEDLALGAAGIETEAGAVAVDDRLRTSNSRVFAIGDVCSSYQFTHAADAMGRVALQNALFFGRKRMSALTIPRVTYTNPEVAHVGIGFDEAERRRGEVQTLTVAMGELDRAVVDGDTLGFACLHLDRRKGTLLGATMVAERAGDCIAELCFALTHRHTVRDLAQTVHPYPTQSEAWKRAADAWSRARLTPRVARLLGFWFEIFGRLG